MPTYVYECAKCGDEFELWQSFAEDPLKKHPQCGGKVTKVLQPVGIVLKGSGFYKNDSRTSKNGRSKKSDSSGEKSGEKSPSSSDSSSTSTPAASPSGSSGGKSDGVKSADNKPATSKPS
jgi:putative FmdB family regulatory protein